MTLAPFTAHIKIIPDRGQQTSTNYVRRAGRFDYVRDMQRLAIRIYQQLEQDAGTEGGPIVLPEPGGGQNRLSGRFGSIEYGGAVKPQIGQSPAQVMIEAFYNTDITTPSEQPNPDTHLIHSNEHVWGVNGPQPWLGTAGLPKVEVEAEVIVLKGIIESAIADVSDDSGMALSLFRLLYKNITWGDRGHHFPR